MIWLRGRAVKCFGLLAHRVLVRKPLLESMKTHNSQTSLQNAWNINISKAWLLFGLLAAWLAGCLAGWLPACLVGLLLCLLLAA